MYEFALVVNYLVFELVKLLARAAAWILALAFAILALTLVSGCSLRGPDPMVSLRASPDTREQSELAAAAWNQMLGEGSVMVLERSGVRVSVVPEAIPHEGDPEGVCGITSLWADNRGDVGVNFMTVTSAGASAGCPAVERIIGHEIAHILCQLYSGDKAQRFACNDVVDGPGHQLKVSELYARICPFIGCEGM